MFVFFSFPIVAFVFFNIEKQSSWKDFFSLKNVNALGQHTLNYTRNISSQSQGSKRKSSPESYEKTLLTIFHFDLCKEISKRAHENCYF